MSFVLKARLGRGKTVDTYHAKLSVQGKTMDVALKKPRPELLTNEEFTRALIDWGKRMSTVEAPELVSVLEAGSTDADGPYVIEEWVRGAPLERALRELRKRKRTFKIELALEIAQKTAAALAKLEGTPHGPHGAIDPSEILIGFNGAVKVGDAGLHRLDWIAGPDAKLPSVYLAPEIAADPNKCSFAADIYAVGLTLLEMLIGQSIWTKENMTALQATYALRDFSHFGAARPELTNGIVEILERALADDPERRFKTAAELHEALTRAHSHNVTEADALGEFVQALIPRGNDEDAPTVMISDDHPDTENNREKVRLLTVMVDPDLEQKARASAQKRGAKAVDPASRSHPVPARTHLTRLDWTLGWKIIALLVIGIAVLLAILLQGPPA
ncbi:MAG: protein kinase [Deltaproteobacteria bacterium]|nr:protein kinase [Deltaproteobacteria bacterium]